MSFTVAESALTDRSQNSLEIDCHSVIKNIQTAFPKPLVAASLPIFNNSAFELVHLLKASRFHNTAENLAPNPARAAGDDRLVFKVVEFSRVNLANKIVGCVGLWNDCSRESTDWRLKLLRASKNIT